MNTFYNGYYVPVIWGAAFYPYRCYDNPHSLISCGRNEYIDYPHVYRKDCAYPKRTTMYAETQRQFPEVDPKLLHESANISRKLMQDATLVLNRFASSLEFGKQVMTAAQESKTEEVLRLIKSTGADSASEVHFNPDSLRVKFESKTSQDADCCQLLIILKWR